MNYFKNGCIGKMIMSTMTRSKWSKSNFSTGSKTSRPSFMRFTLIEILMVIVIMSLLMASAMPAIVDMMKGQGVAAGARNLGQVLKLARSHAINNREYVAVIIPSANVDPTKGLNEKYNFRAYRVALLNKDYSFKRWVQGEGWNVTSVGVAVVDITDSNLANYNAGQTLNPDFLGAEEIPNVRCDDVGSDFADVTLTGVIFKPTGKTTKAALIQVGEATGSGDDLIATAGDDAIIAITINEFTGRVTFE